MERSPGIHLSLTLTCGEGLLEQQLSTLKEQGFDKGDAFGEPCHRGTQLEPWGMRAREATAHDGEELCRMHWEGE